MTYQPTNGIYRFAFDFYKEGGESLGMIACDLASAAGSLLDPAGSFGAAVSGGASGPPGGADGFDFEPVRECLLHEALRRELPQGPSALAPIALAPVWSEDGRPACRAINASLTVSGQRVECELELQYFKRAAETVAQQFVSQGKLDENDAFLFHISAFPQAGAAPAVAAATPDRTESFRIDLAPEPLRVDVAPLSPLFAAADGQGPHDGRDIPVFVPRKVLDEITEIARSAGELESGGALAGRLQRCPERRQLFVEITAAIPARHGEAGTGSFTFTPETWAAVDQTLELRGSSESTVGWFHSHPNFCKKCPADQQRACVFGHPFFSSDDKHLQRAVFPQGHQVGLLISDLGERGLVPALYGWRAAMVHERGFHVVA